MAIAEMQSPTFLRAALDSFAVDRHTDSYHGLQS